MSCAGKVCYLYVSYPCNWNGDIPGVSKRAIWAYNVPFLSMYMVLYKLYQALHNVHTCKVNTYIIRLQYYTSGLYVAGSSLNNTV